MSVALKRWRCIVTWTYSEEVILEAEDADEAGATAREHVMVRHPFADAYEVRHVARHQPGQRYPVRIIVGGDA